MTNRSNPSSNSGSQAGALLLLLAAPTFSTGCAAVDDDHGDGVAWVAGHEGGQTAAIINGVTAEDYPEAALIDMGSALCSGAVIAPRVVLTAGHCVAGQNSWTVTTPYAGGQTSVATRGVVYDYVHSGSRVNPDAHDIGVLVLAEPIRLANYPRLAKTPVKPGSRGFNIGRIRNGEPSHTDLYRSSFVTLRHGSDIGYPTAYYSTATIQQGDSGGPVMATTRNGVHTIIGVNSGAARAIQVMARTDLLYAWVRQQIAEAGSTCQGHTYAGTCKPNGQVIWCDDNKLYGMDCPALGMTCGTNRNGFKDCL